MDDVEVSLERPDDPERHCVSNIINFHSNKYQEFAKWLLGMEKRRLKNELYDIEVKLAMMERQHVSYGIDDLIVDMSAI
jgi:hypothetical protein